MRQEPSRIATARRLRREMTPAEAKLWAILRGRGLAGLKFRRQYMIGSYYADFCCVAAKLVIELDGDSHLGRESHDSNRDDFLKRQGYAVLRFENFEATLTENRVVEVIAEALRERTGQAVGFPIPVTAENEES